MTRETKSPRIEMTKLAPAIYEQMRGFTPLIKDCGIDGSLPELIKVRASQLNGCAFCLDMHIREAKQHGVTDNQLNLLAAWHDAPLFSDPERAALELTEAVTRISAEGVPNELYERVRQFYSPEQYIGLLTTINVINAWNRFMIAFDVPPRFS